MRFFIDTNILVYARDQRTPLKREAARVWLREVANREIATINMQVLNELCHVMLRKFPTVPAEDLRAWVADLREWGDTAVDRAVAEEAWGRRSTADAQAVCLLGELRRVLL
jgi:predicted nucleic acid-binding protein